MRESYDAAPVSTGRVFFGGVLAVSGLLVIGLTPWLFEGVDADEIAVIQSPLSGELTVYTTAGYKWQGLGSVYTYKKRNEFPFKALAQVNAEKLPLGGIQLRFAEGGHATLYGSIQWEMPQDEVTIKQIVQNYKSDEAIRRGLIETSVNKSVYLSGTLMTSKESYAEKRNDLFHYMADQIQNGIYQTRQKREWIKDPITLQDKEIVTAEILHDTNGAPLRQEPSILNQFKIKTFAFTPDIMPYDSTVETQIKQQQMLAMEVQTSIATKAKAEQEAQTAEAQGKANAATKRWEQEAVKAAAVVIAMREQEVAVTNANRDKKVAETAGEQRLNVATFDKQAAEQTKTQNILLGEGEARRKELNFAANGALEPKLATYEKVNEKYADALKGANLVPHLVMGGGGAATGSSAESNPVLDLINLVKAKTAKDLSLDLDTTVHKK